MPEQTPEYGIPYLGNDDTLKETTSVAEASALAYEAELKKLNDRIAALEASGGGGTGGGAGTNRWAAILTRTYNGQANGGNGSCWYGSSGWYFHPRNADGDYDWSWTQWVHNWIAKPGAALPSTERWVGGFTTLTVTNDDESYWMALGEGRDGNMHYNRSVFFVPGQYYAKINSPDGLVNVGDTITFDIG